MWRPAEHPWQYDVLDQLPPSLDVSQLETALAKTPTERVEELMALMRFAEELRAAHQNRDPKK